MRDAMRLGVALLMALCAPPVLAGAVVPSTLHDDAEADVAPDDASATRTRPPGAEPADSPCFPVSVPLWAARFEREDYVPGWAFVDRTARSSAPSCRVEGWATIDPCGRTIPAYLAECPDGTFTFTRTEADCHDVLACRAPREAAAAREPARER